MLFNKKIAIIPDTNIYAPNPDTPYDLTDLPLKKYFKQIENIKTLNLEDNIDILFPEVVLLELLFHHNEKFKNSVNQLKKINKCFINLDIIIEGFENLDCDENYNQLKDKYFNDLKIIPIPQNKEELINEILCRYYEKLPPFEENNDEGFKDTVIFLSILHYAKEKSYDEYVFFSNDNVFKNNNKKYLEDEFNRHIREFPLQEDKFEIQNQKNIDSYINKKFKLFNELRDYISNEFYETLTNHWKNKEKIAIGGVEYDIESFNLIEEKTVINPIKMKFEVEITIELNYHDKISSEIFKKEIQRQYVFKKEGMEWKCGLND